eukprot:CFRG1537T1
MGSHGQSTSCDLSEAWLTIRDGIEGLYRHPEKDMTPKEYMKLYTSIYDYCTRAANTTNINSLHTPMSGNGANIVGRELYQRLVKYLRSYIETIYNELEDDLDDTLLEKFGHRWKLFTQTSKVIHGLFNYLNRYSIARDITENRPEVYPIYTMCVVTWRDVMFMKLKDKLTSGLLKLIMRERNGEAINSGLVTTVIDCYVNLGQGIKSSSLVMYLTYFEGQFIQETTEYYQRECEAFLTENSTSEFMKKVEKRIEEEMKRVKTQLNIDSMDRVMDAMTKVLIDERIDILHSEFKPLLAEEKSEDLGRMYRLISRSNGDCMTKLRKEFEERVRNEGLEAMRQIHSSGTGDDPTTYVDVLLSVHKKYHDMLKVSFEADSEFQTHLDQACRSFINTNAVTQATKNSHRSPELLSKYCDGLLKKSSKNPDSAELDKMLDNTMVIFFYIEDKDVFQKYYRLGLVKRLVQKVSVSDEAETDMINRLKVACGCEYTNKLQRMLQDNSLSGELNSVFSAKVADAFKNDPNHHRLDFTLFVMAISNWPTEQKAEPAVNLPSQVEQYIQQFQKFYDERYTGRRLAWLHKMSKGEIQMHVSSRKYTVLASAYQIMILELFNAAESLTVAEVIVGCGLEEPLAKGLIVSIVKTKILLVENGSGELTPDTVLKFNSSFKNKKLKFNINHTIKTDVKKEDRETNTAIEEDRKLAIQACVVRVMKMRKTRQHQDLIQEVIQTLQTRFKPSVPKIKQAIEHLIEKDYIERMDNNQTYQYKA